MADSSIIYCTQCGRPGSRTHAYCISCGMPRATDARRRAGLVAFVLNELTRPPMTAVLQASEREALAAAYEAQLAELVPLPARPAQAPPQPAPPATARFPLQAAPEPAPASFGIAPPAAAPQPVAAAAPPAPPRAVKPREPMDWSWLAEQQANLFLFAGAFLTVVAALIYVGYSGEAIGASLKMALFSGYTLAFLVAGWFCLEHPRVRIAGRVFFAVGAVLVPMNFAVARTFFSDADVSTQTMWLAGSVVTTAFYFAIAWIGLGRMYAAGAGVAFVSSVAAALAVADAAPEWAPAAFITAAFIMVMTAHTGDERLTSRIGETWTWIGHGLATMAFLFALVIAPAAYDADAEAIETTRWYLPLTISLFAAAASVVALITKRDYLAVAAVAGFGGAVVTVAFGANMPPEGWVIASAAAALALAVLLAGVERIERHLPAATDRVAFITMNLVAGLGVAVGYFTLQATAREADPYTVDWRWFMTIGGALALAAYAVASQTRAGRRRSESVVVAIGGVLAAAATTFGALYARDMAAESYVIAAAGFATALGAVMLAARQPQTARYFPVRLGDVAFAAGVISMAGAAIATFGVLSESTRDVDPYAIGNDWFITIAGALGLAFFALTSFARRGGGQYAESMLIAAGAVAMLPAIVLGALFALERPAEAYAVAIGGMTPAVALAALGLRHDRVRAWVPRAFSDASFAAGVIGSATAGFMIAAIIVASNESPDPYAISTRWFALAALLPCVAFFAIDAAAWRREASALGVILASTGASASFVYGLDASAEYYAFAMLAPATAAAAAVRWTPAAADRALGTWRADAMLIARIIAVAGIVHALGAVLADAGEGADWQPQTRWFLVAAFALATAFTGIDASRGRRVETSGALVAAIVATVVSVPYAYQASAAWYGVAFAGAGIGVAAIGRAYTPPWIDTRVRDAIAVASVAIATVPFEAAYGDLESAGAGVHLAAAAFFAAAALGSPRRATAGRLLDLRGTPPSMGWLYASGAAVTVGYIFMLRATASAEAREGGTLAIPMLTMSAGFLVAGVAARYLRPEFRLHLYAMSLLAAIVSVSAAGDAGTLAWLLTGYVVAWAALAVFEDEPLVGAPSAAFGFLAVAAWRAHGDLSYSLLPMGYAAIALWAYALAFALRSSKPAWFNALRATGATYALVAPAAGFASIAYLSEGRFIDGKPFQETALYQWSTIGVAVAGLIALVESSVARRRWIVVPASAVLLASLLLQIGRFDPDNIQPYTVSIGLYMVLLGAVGLARMRLLDEGEGAAPFIEALGAATVMLPSFVQSLDAGGWRYTLVLLLEAAAFFSAGVALRRRGLLAAAAAFLALVAGRALFDAINAMPNWMVVALVGIGLLGIGLGILMGRDRWERWQRAVVSWWEDAGGHAHAH